MRWSLNVVATILLLVGLKILALEPAKPALAQSSAPSQEIGRVIKEATDFYLDVHQHPELSSRETETAAKLAAALGNHGFDVTERVGGTGIVAVLKNGPGPTVMLRTELDGLPVEEKTGLAYASKVRSKDETGSDVPVMHACGHDLHMAALLGTAAILASSRNTWSGTLLLIGQPAEETLTGAKAMLADGLYSRFPRPDIVFELHTTNELPAGKIGIASGYRYANADSLKIVIFGRGGHGSRPQSTIDPIVIAAKTILSLQTIVSREVKPGDIAVVTVGYIRAGTKNNIIPDRAELGLTVRSYKPEVRKQLLMAIERIVKGEAMAAGAETAPTVEQYESTDAVFSDPALAGRLKPVLESTLGAANVTIAEAVTGSEDFSYFMQQGIPGLVFVLGGAERKRFDAAAASGTLHTLPTNHSPLFAPDLDPALRAGITAEVATLRHLLKRP